MAQRRAALRARIDTRGEFEVWEETCLPSYCHPNLAAAWVSWQRLFAAVDLAGESIGAGPVLDFGAAVGELAHLLPSDVEYEWIEEHEPAARYLAAEHPRSRRVRLEEAPAGRYRCVFALDALEHNEDYAALVDRLLATLAPGGLFVVSGPTENVLYRLGRRIAGFEGHYHSTDIHAIEDAIRKRATLLRTRIVPWPIPLFRVTAWTAAPASSPP